MTYTPPIKAIQYLLKHAVDIDEILDTELHSDVGHDLISDILEGASSFAGDILAPLNWEGDQNPAKLEGDNVIASPGFDDAYKAWVEGGWQTLPIDEAIGGMALPQVVKSTSP